MILLTGATGFLGEDLVAALSKGSLRCLVRNPEQAFFLKDFNARIAVGDVTDASSLEKALTGVSVVVHAAAVISGTDADYEKVNVEGTRNLVSAAKKAGVGRFVFISSILAAYEKTTAYGKSKLAAEEIVRSSGIPFTILRVSLVYRKNDTRMVGKLIKVVSMMPVVPLVGSGAKPLQPVYSGDVASAVACAAGMKPKNAAYYLVGPVTSFREMVVSIASVLGKRRFLVPVPVFLFRLALLLPVPFNQGQLDFLSSGKTFDYTPASRELGFRPVSFREGLKRSLE